MYEQIAYAQDGPVTLIAIDRPERMNAIGSQTHRELVDAWQRFRDDDGAHVAVLTGAGDKAFCAGGDLKSATDGERGFGRPLDEGLRIEAECFDRSIFSEETLEGLRRFNERDHPDRIRGGVPGRP